MQYIISMVILKSSLKQANLIISVPAVCWKESTWFSAVFKCLFIFRLQTGHLLSQHHWLNRPCGQQELQNMLEKRQWWMTL